MFNFETKNISFFKEVNKLKILREVWFSPLISRVKLSKKIGLSRSTITSITKRLIEDGVLKEIGLGNSTSSGGKRPTMLDYSEKVGLIIGCTIDFNIIDIALSDIRANIIKRKILKRFENETAIETLKKILILIKEILKENSYKILGIGFSIPGMIDHINGKVIFSPNMPGWEKVNVKEILENELKNIKCFLDSETRLQIFAEKWFGQGMELNNFITIEAGVGVGIGIFLDDEIYRGNNLIAGEFGHTTMLPNGTLCHCGNSGCFETLASTRTVIERAIKGIETKSTLLSKYKIITFDSIVECASNNDEFAQSLIKDYIYWLGLGIANIVNIFDPERVIIYDQATLLGDPWINYLQDIVNEHALPLIDRKVDIKFSKFGKNAKMLGAFGIVIKKFFDIPDKFYY